MTKINRTFMATLACTALIFSSCQNNSSHHASNDQDTISTKDEIQFVVTEVPFTIAERYFIKNTVEKVTNPKIETKEDFDALFGVAAVMGEKGKPTEIDFSKQYVIAVTLPETDFATTIEPVDLTRQDDGSIEFTYTVLMGEKKSFKIRPVLLLVVDKIHEGDIYVKELG